MSRSLTIKFTVLSLAAVFMITAGLRCTFIAPSERELLAPVNLSWWGVAENENGVNQLIADYRAIHPNIQITYRRLREEEFESELINALAEDRGPDIFTIRNSWVDEYLTKISPLPPTTKLAYQQTQRSLGVKEETIVEIRENTSITVGQLRNSFVDVVSDDVIRDNKIYGLPISVDTLAMFYNKDLLNNAGIALPATNWLQFQDQIKQLTFQNRQGDLIQSGVAMGRADNVKYYFDLLSLLMLQNGAQMVNGQRAYFAFVPPGGDNTYNPGPEALRFYTDFANPTKEVFTWDDNFAPSLDAFAAGNVAYAFGYSTDKAVVDAKRQGKLNYDITTMPQIDGRPMVNYARYWVNTVSNKTDNINEAWDFAQFIATRTEAGKYLETTNQPTALRSLIETQTADDSLRPFASQLLTAKSWYHGKDSKAAANAFAEMIDAVLNQGFVPSKAAEIATQKVDQTLR